MPVAGALIGVAGSAVAGKQGADAAGAASAAGVQGSQDAIRAQLAMYNQSRADTLPQQVTGTGALNMLAQMYGLPTYSGGGSGASSGGIQLTGGTTETKQKKRSLFDKITDPLNISKQFGGTSYDPMGFFSSGTETNTTPMNFTTGEGGALGAGGATVPGTGVADFSQFYKSPDYQVAVDEATEGLDRGAAARGRLYSGGFDADRMREAGRIGSKYFGNFTGNLMQLAGLGNSANSQLNQLGQGVANQVGQQYNNAGNARAAGITNQANAWGNAQQGIASGLGQLWGQQGQSTAPTAANGWSAVQREPIPQYIPTYY